MSPSPPDLDPAAADLAGILDRAIARGGHLLTRGERCVVERMRALPPEAMSLFAKLTLRVGTVWGRDSLPEEPVQSLERAGLLSPLVSWSQRVEASTVPELKAGCRALGLAVGGKREALVERLKGHVGWTARAFVRLCHPGLVRRLEQWAMLRRHPDRSAAVVGRLGIVHWPEYALTSGPRLFPTRSTWRRWWERDVAIDTVQPEVWLDWLSDLTPAPGRLSLRGPLVRRVRHAARELERAGEPDRAVQLYQGLDALGVTPTSRLACRWALALEASGESEAALAVLQSARSDAEDGQALAIARTGRRLAKRMRRGWPPDRPLRDPVERTVTLTQQPTDGARPRWGQEDAARTIELAVMGHLAARGRTAVRGEAPLWRTVVTLLFTPVLFAPVAGQLPVRFLTAPLDWGTPDFIRRRAGDVDIILQSIEEGGAEERMAGACARWRDTALSGVRWQYTSDQLIQVARGMPPLALAGLCRHLLTHGRRGGAGLPDSIILPGPRASIEGFPSRVPPGFLFVEVKGPTDAVRDEQRVWLDRLMHWGVGAELWHVKAR